MLPLQGGLIAIQRDKEPFLDIAIRAMSQIFHPKLPFLTGRVMDILFNGIGIDCDHTEWEATSFCGALQNEKGFRVVNDTYLTFSILGGVSWKFVSNFSQ